MKMRKEKILNNTVFRKDTLMLKLLIVDDEEIVCNTIAKVIPWRNLE